MDAVIKNNVTSTQIRMHVAAQNRRHSDVVLVLIIIAIIKFQGRRPSQALEPKAITGLRLAAIETAAWGAVGRLPGPPDRGRRAVSFLLDLGRPLPATRASCRRNPPRAARPCPLPIPRDGIIFFPLSRCIFAAGVSARGLRVGGAPCTSPWGSSTASRRAQMGGLSGPGRQDVDAAFRATATARARRRPVRP